MFRMIIVTLMLLASSLSYAQVDFLPLDALPQGAIKGTGELSELNTAERTVVISGLFYNFAARSAVPPLEVILLGRDFGALQLLRDGMHVEFYYLDVDGSKVIKALIEVTGSDDV